ncbi:MAG: hypothetical protein HeimC2_25090 [Candidatus Heimdallarchaeota archaeon LC_2]|nr:MAG: hypothetical protein HeimC2_25090 [Candidatus Heimdallarchaeota archaeon LC_2]
MKFQYLIVFLLTSFLISSASGGVIIYWTHEFQVGDTFDMELVDLKLNGPNSFEADFPGTNYSATPSDIGLIVSNMIMEITAANLSTSLSNRHDRLQLNQSSQGINFEYSVESILSYQPDFAKWYFYKTALRPTYVIYNDWNWQKNQVTNDWGGSGYNVLNLSWTETVDIFTIAYEVDRLGQFENYQEYHMEKVEEGYFKNTGIIAYFNLFVDIIQDKKPLQYEILIANTQCDIDECLSRRGFLEASLNNTKSENEDNQLLPSFSPGLSRSIIFVLIFSASLTLGVLVLIRKNK